MSKVFGIPLGVDFPAGLVNGLLSEYQGRPPEDLARVNLIVNTNRMARRIRDIFDAGNAALMPRIMLLTDLAKLVWDAEIPAAQSPLRRRLELVQLVSALLEREPDLAPRSSIFDLADSLANLMNEMQGEGVDPSVLETLNVDDLSGHWDRALTFLKIIRPFFDPDLKSPDPEMRGRLIVAALREKYKICPPKDPIILAGSTGSRGTTQELMKVICDLPLGKIILPGFDFDMTAEHFDQLKSSHTKTPDAEDHPQYRFYRLMQVLNVSRDDIHPWAADMPTAPDRNKAISLALRPAPVTDQWLAEGPSLANLETAFSELTLVQAPNQRAEAMAIALRLRAAAENNESAALITPDRVLTRQVTAALARWGIIPDDSAGIPLHLTASGRFLRHIGAMYQGEISLSDLIVLLKHPITHSGSDRGEHLLLTRDLELLMRSNNWRSLSPEKLIEFSEKHHSPLAASWAKWILANFTPQTPPNFDNLGSRLNRHIAIACAVAAGSQTHTGEGSLWEGDAGQKAHSVVDELQKHSDATGPVSTRDYLSIFNAVLSRGEVRNSQIVHPKILIWGSLEARVMGADLIILGGLNEGVWPATPTPDPWLNRVLRQEAGLLLPDRRIGLSAHDFQQAIAAPRVWLTRSMKSDDAETVPSRWLNRILNMLQGLPDQGGQQAVNKMINRGAEWLARVDIFETTKTVPKATRPSPIPPVTARPTEVSVTEIRRLIRDPYAVYAKRVLDLKPLSPIENEPTPADRGIVLHKILERFVRSISGTGIRPNYDHLITMAQDHFEEKISDPVLRMAWLSRFEEIAKDFIAAEEVRQLNSPTSRTEIQGRFEFSEIPMTLTGYADRIDILPEGGVHIVDYKSGTVPTKRQQLYFDKQLLIEAAMIENGAFSDIPPTSEIRAYYVGIGAKYTEVDAPIAEETPAQTWERLRKLLITYRDENKGYTARRAAEYEGDYDDYDGISRFGEWDITDDVYPQKVGQ